MNSERYWEGKLKVETLLSIACIKEERWGEKESLSTRGHHRGTTSAGIYWERTPAEGGEGLTDRGHQQGLTDRGHQQREERDLLTEDIKLVMDRNWLHEESLKAVTCGVIQQLQGKTSLMLEPAITLLADISTQVQQPTGIQEHHIKGRMEALNGGFGGQRREGEAEGFLCPIG